MVTFPRPNQLNQILLIDWGMRIAQ